VSTQPAPSRAHVAVTGSPNGFYWRGALHLAQSHRLLGYFELLALPLSGREVSHLRQQCDQLSRIVTGPSVCLDPQERSDAGVVDADLDRLARIARLTRV